MSIVSSATIAVSTTMPALACASRQYLQQQAGLSHCWCCHWQCCSGMGLALQLQGDMLHEHIGGKTLQKAQHSTVTLQH